MGNKSWQELVKEHKTLLVIIIIGFFLIEIEIFTVAAMKSGRQSWMQVLDGSGDVIYQVKGSTMTNFNKYYFENTFGPFQDYQVKLITEDKPFPFRAWFSAAVGLPVGLVLLLAFVLKAVMAFIHGKPEPDASPEGNNGHDQAGTGFDKIFTRISQLNIFIIGFLIFAGVFLYWVLPNLLTFLAKVSMDTIITYKWVFIGGTGALFLLFAWFMYMKYQLAKKTIDAQTEIRKHELRLEYVRTGHGLTALEYNETRDNKMLDYNGPEPVDPALKDEL